MEWPREWQEVANRILLGGGIVIVLGAIDTGKTTFVTYLTNLGWEQGRKVAIVDADMGQSDIGPPTTIGLGLAERKLGSLSDAKVVGLYFVGSVSPEGHLLQTVVGTKKMVEKAGALGADCIIVDTTGLVQGEIGRALKQNKIELVNPQHLVAFQSGSEIEHLLYPLREKRGLNIYRLKVDLKVRERSPEERRLYREKKMFEYFSRIETLEIGLDTLSISRTPLGSGERLSPKDKENISKAIDDIVLYGEWLPEGLFLVTIDSLIERNLSYLQRTYGVEKVFVATQDDFSNLLVSLLDKSSEVICLGIINRIDFGKNVIYLSIPFGIKKEEIKGLQFSKFKVNLKERKMGYW